MSRDRCQLCRETSHPWLHYFLVSDIFAIRINCRRPECSSNYSNGAGGGDAQWPSSRSPSAFNARKVESLVTWLYTSIVTAIWLWRSICMATCGWTPSATSRDAQALRVACTVVVGAPARPRWVWKAP